MSQFGIINDKLREQLREILEADDSSQDSKVFKQAKDHYKACMDLKKLEEIGLGPLQQALEKFGGWPVLMDKWEQSSFDW